MRSALRAEPALDAFRISVSTSQQVVLLSGFVDSAQNAWLAEEVTSTVPGVSSARNDLLVK